MKNKTVSVTGLVLFFLGIFLGLFLFGGLSWADLESNFYFGYGVKGTNHLKLNCPLLMTSSETNQVTAIVSNTTDRLAEPRFRADISYGNAILRRVESQVQIEAGQEALVSWDLMPGDVVFRHLILVQVYELPAFLLPSADGACGVFVLDIPGLDGLQVYILLLVVTLLFAGGGFAVWIYANRPLEGRVLLQARGLIFLGSIVVLGIVFASLGAWGLGILCMALSVLATGVMIGNFFLETR